MVRRRRRDLASLQGVMAFVVEFSFYNISGEGGETALAYSIRGPELDELERETLDYALDGFNVEAISDMIDATDAEIRRALVSLLDGGALERVR